MKILLAAVNSRFNHTNIAVRSLCLYARKFFPDTADDITFDEWTINMNSGEILRGIEKHKPNVILLSTYIWNAEIIQKIIPDIKKIIPDSIVACGGPEAGFCGEIYLNRFPELDFIMKGEGEETFRELCSILFSKNFCADNFFSSIKNIKGIYCRDRKKEIIFTGERELICNIDELPFPYERITEPDTRIYYYESSRGCPFNCAYCMSSLDKRVRFMSTEKVCRDLKTFMDADVALVKFVDRTYNLNEERYINIWKYIVEHHNNKTMFHFEIEAEYLSEKALNFLQTVPKGVMQFEIGVQSSNPETLQEVGRSPETLKLAQNIRRIPETIHTHLDLIAGLPFENLEIFGKSFNFVMNLKPDALQLGFLKVLHGTTMETYAKNNNWKWMSNPPYETFSTPYLSYNDMMFLKDLEILLDAFYNSGIFGTAIKFIERKSGWWNFFYSATELAQKTGALDSPNKTEYWITWLAENHMELQLSDSKNTLLQLLKFDYLRQGKTSRFPEWFKHNYSKANHLEAMNKNENRFDSRIEFSFSDYDEFSVNPLAELPENTSGKFRILFVYRRHNSLITDTQILLD